MKKKKPTVIELRTIKGSMMTKRCIVCGELMPARKQWFCSDVCQRISKKPGAMVDK